MVLLSLSAVIFHVIGGGTKETNKNKKLLSITHGVGLLISLVAGFGLIARLGLHSFPVWVWVKLLIWLWFGAITAVVYKKPAVAKKIWFLALVLASFASFLAVNKPF